MLADLFHAEGVCGTSTVGSSEAILLGGIAMKRRWSEKRKAEGKPLAQCNMVCGSEVHVGSPLSVSPGTICHYILHVPQNVQCYELFVHPAEVAPAPAPCKGSKLNDKSVDTCGWSLLGCRDMFLCANVLARFSQAWTRGSWTVRGH
jgi:hypothetical protein